MKLGLSYRGRQLAIDPGFTIEFRAEDDWFDWTTLGQQYTFPVSIPVKGNEWAFYFASDPATAKNRFKTYDGFAITWGGNIWWEGALELTGLSRDGRYYQGTLSVIESILFQNMGKSIRELLADTTWSYPAGGYQTVYDYYNLAYRGIRFPWMHFYNQTLFHPDTDARIDIFNKDVYACPCFHLYDLVKLILSSYGYTLLMNITNLDEVKKRIIFTNHVFQIDDAGESRSYGKHLPDLTLGQLLYELSFFSGAKAKVDLDAKTVTYTSLQYIEAKTPLDISDHVHPVYGVQNDPDTNVRVGYNTAIDSLLSDNPDELTGNYLGEIDAGPPSTPAEGDYYFDRQFNAYYKYFTWEGSVVKEFYSHPFLSRQSGDSNLVDYSSELSPCLKDIFTYEEYDVSCDLLLQDLVGVDYCKVQGFDDPSVVRTSGFIGIIEFQNRETQSSTPPKTGYVSPNVKTGVARPSPETPFRTRTSPNTPYKVRVPGTNKSAYKTTKVVKNEYYIGVQQTKLYPIHSGTTGANPNDNQIRFFLDYLTDEKVKKLLFAEEHGYIFPVVGDTVYTEKSTNKLKSDASNDFTGRVLTWHGMQFNFGLQFKYPYASCDNYFYDSTNGITELDADSLNLHVGTRNIWDKIFYLVSESLQSTRRLLLTCFLSPVKVSNLIQVGKARFQKGVFRFASFKATLMGNGMRDQEIEGFI